MAKRTKFSKFRDLYEVIEELAVSYTYEGVVEILAERHDLILGIEEFLHHCTNAPVPSGWPG